MDVRLGVEREPEEKPKYKACHICHGMGGIETPSGDLRDCPNRKCSNGMVQINERDKNDKIT